MYVSVYKNFCIWRNARLLAVYLSYRRERFGVSCTYFKLPKKNWPKMHIYIGNGKWETCPNLTEGRSLVRVWLEYLWQERPVTLLGVERERESLWGYVGMHESWEDNISDEEQWANIGTERTRCSQIIVTCEGRMQHRWQVTHSRSRRCVYVERLFPQQLFAVVVMDAPSTARLRLLTLWLLKIMPKWVTNGVTTINPIHYRPGNSGIDLERV